MALSTILMNCCMANGSQALYYPWESTVRYSSGTACVNLLLNRALPWLDMDSCLPYEGKVVPYNKQAKCVFVHIPGWVDQHAVRCEVDGNPRTPLFAGNCLLLDPLQANSTITLSFPMREETQKFVLDDYGHKGPQVLKTYTYDITFRGNTPVKVVSSVEETKTCEHTKPAAVPTRAVYQKRE